MNQDATTTPRPLGPVPLADMPSLPDFIGWASKESAECLSEMLVAYQAAKAVAQQIDTHDKHEAELSFGRSAIRVYAVGIVSDGGTYEASVAIQVNGHGDVIAKVEHHERNRSYRPGRAGAFNIDAIVEAVISEADHQLAGLEKLAAANEARAEARKIRSARGWDELSSVTIEGTVDGPRFGVETERVKATGLTEAETAALLMTLKNALGELGTF